jgi:hypothetical protein
MHACDPDFHKQGETERENRGEETQTDLEAKLVVHLLARRRRHNAVPEQPHAAKGLHEVEWVLTRMHVCVCVCVCVCGM